MQIKIGNGRSLNIKYQYLIAICQLRIATISIYLHKVGLYPENITVPAIKEFLIIDLLVPAVFVKSLFKNEILEILNNKNDNRFHFI